MRKSWTHSLIEREEEGVVVVPDLVRYRQALEEEVHEEAAGGEEDSVSEPSAW